eukprot:gene10020-13503_t
MDGYAVAQEIRRHAALRGTPMVAVTSYAMVGDREKSLEAGCNGYIEKPINPETTPMKQILIVDDKEENLYYLEALLTGAGFTVTCARHGAEALVKARQAPPDLIISDLLMPVMDGYTLLRHWKLDRGLKQIPFIVYTATYTEAEDERLALNLGADAFILKPAEPEDFLLRLRAVQANANLDEAGAIGEAIGDEEVRFDVQIKALGTRGGALEDAEALLRRLLARRDPIRLNALYFGMMWTTLRVGKLERCVEICDAGVELAYRIGTLP